jgi:hypothetical protein
MSRKTVHAVKAPQGGWNVKIVGAERALVHTPLAGPSRTGRALFKGFGLAGVILYGGVGHAACGTMVDQQIRHPGSDEARRPVVSKVIEREMGKLTVPSTRESLITKYYEEEGSK